MERRLARAGAAHVACRRLLSGPRMSAWVPLIVGLFAAAISIAVPIVVPKGPNSEYVRGGLLFSCTGSALLHAGLRPNAMLQCAKGFPRDDVCLLLLDVSQALRQ